MNTDFTKHQFDVLFGCGRCLSEAEPSDVERSWCNIIRVLHTRRRINQKGSDFNASRRWQLHHHY